MSPRAFGPLAGNQRRPSCRTVPSEDVAAPRQPRGLAVGPDPEPALARRRGGSRGSAPRRRPSRGATRSPARRPGCGSRPRASPARRCPGRPRAPRRAPRPRRSCRATRSWRRSGSGPTRPTRRGRSGAGADHGRTRETPCRHTTPEPIRPAMPPTNVPTIGTRRSVTSQRASERVARLPAWRWSRSALAWIGGRAAGRAVACSGGPGRSRASSWRNTGGACQPVTRRASPFRRAFGRSR